MPVKAMDPFAKLHLWCRPVPSGCIEWTGSRFTNGYGILTHKDRHLLAHRVAWQEANGPIPEGMVVMHLCDNRPCVNVEHLRLGTQADNMRDAKEKGRLKSAHGSLSSRARLSDKGVIDIRRRRLAGETCAALAAEYGVSAKQISVVSRGVQWGHVAGAVASAGLQKLASRHVRGMIGGDGDLR